MHDFTDGVDVVRRFFKRQLNRLKPNLVGLTSAVSSAFGYHHRESSATTFGGNYDYVASRQVKTDIEIPPAPPVAPMRMSVLNLVTHADQSSDVQQQMNGGSPLSMDETNDQEQLNELEMFPEPPSISVHDIEKVFQNIIPSENSADETELSISSGEGVLQRECINQDDGFKDDSSTLDRPIGKRKAIYLKRVETLDVESSTKPVSQTSIPQNRHHSSRRPHMKLNVDESRLRESLRLLKTEVASNSSIERPRSTGASYHFLSLIQK
uniref:Uncharacterized protein n=1 Tax=Panagrellus redivivus TaxID=6233 RepID=A0A7E5A141_PANRE